MTKMSQGRNVEANEPHWIEWATGILSAFLVIAVILWIGKDALTDRDTSPDLVARVVRIEKRSDGYQVLFEIQNNSSSSASQVTVLGEIPDQSSPPESVETVLDYVPGHSRAKGGFVFQNDPEGKTMSIRVSAFNEP